MTPRLFFGHVVATLGVGVACSAQPEPASPASAPKDGSSTEAASPAPLPRDVVSRAAHRFSGWDVAGSRALTDVELLGDVAAATAICVGESHPEPADHYAQLRVLEHLLEGKRDVALGMEMFQTPYQGALNAYRAGEITEAALLLDTEYAKRWGFDFSLYRPLVEAAVASDTAILLALNTPRELTKAVAKGGLDSLSAEQKAALPELDLTNAEHRAYFDEAMTHHPPGMNLDNFYAAQVLWDETMAARAAEWVLQDPKRQILVVAGAGHCQTSGIPARLRRRGVASVLSVIPLSLETFSRDQAASKLPAADRLWIVGEPIKEHQVEVLP